MKPFVLQSTARVLLFALVYLLAACGGGAGAAPPTLGPIVRAAPPTAAPTQPASPTAAPTDAIPPATTAQPSAANVLISYHKSGGIAGVNETLTVYTDGTIEMRGKSGAISTRRADPSDVQALHKLLVSPEFAALQLPMQPPAPDQFIYELTVPGRAKPIVVADGADNPAVLRELIDVLEKLNAQAK